MEHGRTDTFDIETQPSLHLLETDSTSRSELLSAIVNYGEVFLNTLQERKAYEHSAHERKGTDDFFEIDQARYSIEDILPFLAQRLDVPGINTASGGHMGYIPGGGIYESALGDYLAAVTNRYAGVFFASPGAVRMENALIRWAARLIGYTDSFAGNLTSGGSMANLIAVSTAREAQNIKSRQVDQSVIYTTQQAHHSLQKAIRLCGLEECVLRFVEQDLQYKMVPQALEAQIQEDTTNGLKPFLIIANAGSTDIGTVDPLDDIAHIARKYSLWFHVDAAYGGFFMLTDYGRQIMKGIEKADSVILDPHKGLFLPYGSGIVLVKEQRHLAQANRYEANYMQDTKDYHEETSPAELSPELSTHFRGMRMWLPLKLHGTAPFRSCLEEKLDLARYLHARLKDLGFEVGPYPTLTTVIFRHVPNEQNANACNTALVKAIHKDGRIFVSSTSLKGHVYLRASILSFRTHRREVDLLIQILEKERALLETQP